MGANAHKHLGHAQWRSNFATQAVHNIHDAGGQTNGHAHLAEQVRGDRREFGGFAHNRVAARERGCDFPAQQVQRPVASKRDIRW